MSGSNNEAGGIPVLPWKSTERLPPNGGGPDDPGMEARVAALESSTRAIEVAVKDIGRDIAEMKAGQAELRKEVLDQAKTLARLDGRVSQLPSTLQLIGFVLAVLALAGLSKFFAP